ncbi:hypothetical protein BJF83_17345 [Nocardiopsis sp. CNR-923]|uniref:capsid assembly scaffolding protein Gp46 family protein n=1 Tax=Nocardiopsis sp. CNR-923 TaxID=1904965 RepID=UPI00096594D7|nr:DUF4355 domain-containing protein [Nocardiopsis sp. CNR-923]OLT27750.1 hypothetical protein BJF83_17345 [Nocardiopsis sp. CNR-923]
MNALPTHPTTGLRALGWTRRGPIWPVLGGDGTGGAPPAGEGQGSGDGGQNSGAGRTFGQADVDRIVADRLAREREKYSDYADLRKKAAELDKIQDAQRTEAEKLQQQLAEAATRAEKAERSLWVAEAARKHQVPDDAIEFLTGTTAEEIEAKAVKLAKLGGNSGGGEGRDTNDDGQGQGAPTGGTNGGNQRRPDPSQGQGSRGEGGGSVATGRDLYAQRKHKKTTT